MEDKVQCQICGYEGLDISSHLRGVHNLSASEYKVKYGGFVISPSVDLKRKSTTERLHGDPNWRNEEARKLMYSAYEGGHPLKDSSVIEKAKETKVRLYGDPGYTNMPKRVSTNMGKYGVPHSCMAEEVIEKRVETLKRKYGKVFNCPPPEKTVPADPESFKTDYLSGMSYIELGKRYGKTEPVLRRWANEMGLSRVVKASTKKYESPKDIVSEYLCLCYDKKASLSFYDYGQTAGTKHMNRMKRLFNAGKKYAHLRQELFKVAGDKSLYLEFLENFEGSR